MRGVELCLDRQLLRLFLWKTISSWFIFNNQEVKEFDVRPYIMGEWYERLKDPSYFRAVMVDGYTVCWPEGQDLCSDELYELSIPVR